MFQLYKPKNKILQKCSKCENIEERISFRLKPVCFRCKMKRMNAYAKSNISINKERILIKKSTPKTKEERHLKFLAEHREIGRHQEEVNRIYRVKSERDKTNNKLGKEFYEIRMKGFYYSDIAKAYKDVGIKPATVSQMVKKYKKSKSTPSDS